MNDKNRNNDKHSTKKAQVSLFIILGIALVITVFIIAFYTSKEKDEQIGEVDIDSPQANVIKNLVDSCVMPAIYEGIEIMSLQGGYIFLPEYQKTVYVKDPEGRTVKEVNGRLKVEQGNGFNKVPYWITRDSWGFITSDSMERQLERYVELETSECIDGFFSLSLQGYNITYKEPLSDVEIGESVVVNVNFPIDARIDDKSVSIENFRYEVGIRLKDIHQLALKIASNEDLYSFIESDTKQWISVYSGLDEDKLPPFTATTSNLDCSYVTWDEKNSEEYLKNIIDKNIGLINVEGVSNPLIKDSSEDPKFIESLKVDVGADDEDMQVKFDYEPDNGMIRFDIKPKSGEGISPPDRVSSRNVPLLPKICTFSYRYKYDVEYPVIVEITDTLSEKADMSREKGFSFKFPLWVYICGNNERHCKDTADYIRQGYQVDKQVQEMTSEIVQGFCDEDNMKSQPVKIKAVNRNNEEVEGVDINYVCGSESNNCYIGKANKRDLKMPMCKNGILVFSKEGYGDVKKIFSSYSYDNGEVEVVMDKQKDLDVDVGIIDAVQFIDLYVKGKLEDLDRIVTEVSSREEVLISARGPTDFYHMFPEDDDTVKVSTGKYKIDMIFKGEARISPEQIGGEIISYDTDGSGTYQGQWIFKNMQGIDWELGYQELGSGSKIMFYVLSDLRSYDDISTADIYDDIFDEEGNIAAEVLYRGNMVQGECKEPFRIIAANGLYQRDLSAGDCEHIEEVIIKKEDYVKYILPKVR